MDDDDVPVLSEYALKALQEFYDSQKTAEEEETISEDWQLSQFWYSDETANILAREALDHTVPNQIIAFVSSPTAYQAFKKMQFGERKPYVFEFDKRFSRFGADFVFFDFNDISTVPDELRSKVNFVVADPPFLSQDCLEKTADCIDALLAPNGSLLIATGLVQDEVIKGRWKGKMKRTTWSPQHEGSRLQNPFGCWINYSSSHLSFEKE